MDLFNSQYILAEKRWLWVDYDKGISIMLVGYGHCLSTLEGHSADLHSHTILNYIGTFFYGFRMPLFFIVSGLLVGRGLKKKGLANYIGDRTNNILYPLLVWGVIEISFQIIASTYTHFTLHERVSFWRFADLIINPRETGHFWYLNALFCIGVLYATLKSALKLKPIFQLAFGLILYVLSAYLHINDIPAGLFTDIFEYYVFFALGDVISNALLDENTIRAYSSWRIFVPLLVAFIIVQYFSTGINLRPSSYGNRLVEQKMPLFFFIEALIGCAASISFSFLLQKYKLFTWIRIVGYHSLFIYCMQIIVMTFARIFFQNFLSINYTPALVILIWSSGIFLPVVFYNFCLRYNLWWLYTFKKPEKQVNYLRDTNIFKFTFNSK